ncbi:DUF805 domain-containing protein [Emticicia sp. C21]|uniref:DUF805 domain-containing protein n=1 Tax=Emticicia sp. C21 TaxID=2302915 RepID=UPI000E34CFA6|nr:DUF805 domain-containing protein [Emticicia sp. C21]RFS14330.1 DUF805 domain-containing protein [Emticicia sp. C21]
MFKAPFSFDGRIRRTEYGITLIIYFILYSIIFFTIVTKPEIGPIVVLIFIIPMLWFLWAQGAKRCHDLDRNGWYQIIPFYFLWLLFQDGEPGENQYGLNPKGIGNESSYDDQISQIGKSLES